MSYILEALKEAQKRRDDSRVPTLRTVQVESTAKPARTKKWLIPVVGLTSLGLAGALLYLGLGEDRDSVVTQEVGDAARPHAEAIAQARAGDLSKQASVPVGEQKPVEQRSVEQRSVDNNPVERTTLEQAPELTEITAKTPPVPTPVIATPAASAPAKASVTPPRQLAPSKNVAMARVPATSAPDVGTEVESNLKVDGSAQIKRPATQAQEPVSIAPGPATPRLEERKVPVQAISPTSPGAWDKLPAPEADGTKVATKATTPPALEARQVVPERSIRRTEVDSHVIENAEPEPEVLATGQEPVADGVEAKPVPHFRELPYDIQQSLPVISYSVHLYAAEPSHRMVKIDGRVRREGDTVKPGLVLKEITPTGAIFSYRDNIFRVPVNG